MKTPGSLSPMALVGVAHSPVSDPEPFPPDRLARCRDGLAVRAAGLKARLLAPPPCAPESFRIPPIYKRAVSALSLNLLWLTRQMMTDRVFTCDLDQTEVIVGVCGGFDATLRNALKVSGVVALSDQKPDAVLRGKRALQEHFGSTTHDKVGEMASIIAARIGQEIGSHGRVIALESADATLFSAFETAAINLSAGKSDTAIIAVGQRFEGSHMALALTEVLCGERFEDQSETVVLREGASVFCMRRLDAAQRDGDPILAVIDGFVSRQFDQSAPRAHDNLKAASRVAGNLPARMQRVCGMTYRGLDCDAGSEFGLAHDAVAGLRDAMDALADTSSATLYGHSLYGRCWAMRLCNASSQVLDRNHLEPPDAEPIAIVGTGASYGPFIGRDAVFSAFGAGTDGIAALSESALPRHAGFDLDKSVPLTSYAQLGSELMTATVSTASTLATQTDAVHRLAFTVGAEALDQALDDASAAPKGDRWSVIVAAQLCSEAERRMSNAVHEAEVAATLSLPIPIGSTALTFAGLLPGETAMQLSTSFGLNAPGMAVESACASSLAALEVAVRQLRAGIYDAVLVVAAELPNNQRDLTLCSAQRMLSGDRIAPFAQCADGFSPGDGAGAVVLRRLTDALAQNQPVQGIIRGIGSSSDAVSFTAPDPRGQVRAMRRALHDASISAQSVGYVEAHGTGTVRGDGIEIEALSKVYGQSAGCTTGLGSVKSMIGHTFAAAGMAGLLRAVQAVSTATVPPTILRGPLNSQLGTDQSIWQISDCTRPWRDNAEPRRAAVNALGTGGTNYHLIVEAASEPSLQPMEAP